ncbi:hypothetical protein Sya03_00610 [Spirilliplanes yamanashiensis]|uniref:Endonuclease/exonuclease/phosphatase domain-containing protein n=1 Tax=Spirilliplanes yamanashiensis TaxID=42233 RepID=A0A8J3Y3C0_9ACTN|nr:putative extracellular nuclease [Spirilliplanes yamanashiensis]GIJ00709.1 hypothetical protein Sya03_00610 [Spirilliplanes yamanashiensis]
MRPLAVLSSLAALVAVTVPAVPALAAAEPVLTVGQVQGVTRELPRTHRSPLAPATGNNPSAAAYQVRGVITQRTLARTATGADQHGFFLQSRRDAADGDPATSDGVFVFMGAFTDLRGGYVPVVGDEVVLSARVSEYFSMTQLSGASLVAKLASGVTDVEVADAAPPAELAAAELWWERHEGMQLRVRDGAGVVSGRNVFAGTADAETWVLDRDDPALDRPGFAARTFRDAHPLDRVPDGNGGRVLLGSLGVKAAARDNTALLAPAHTFDRLSGDAVGGVYYSFNKYGVQPAAAAFEAGRDPSANHPPRPARRAAEVAISTYNVENLYDFRDDPFDGCDFAGNPGCPGVRPPFDYVPASAAEYTAQLAALADQIVADLHAPDLILVQEAEDQDICAVSGGELVCGAANDADGAPDTLQELALAVAAAGGPEYRAAYDRTGADDRGITAAFLYRTDRMALAAPRSVLTADPRVEYRAAALPSNAQVSNPKALNAVRPSDMDTSTGVDGPNVYTRAPQVALFTVRTPTGGYPLWAVSNHFSSTPDARVGQRREQARYGAAIVTALPAGERVVYGGDLNVFPRPDDPTPAAPGDQLAALYDDAGLTNLWERLPAASAYSYVFDGQAQTLDHVFVNDALLGDLVEMRAAHVNADWPAEFAGDGSRGSSDHDPQVARFRSTPALSVGDASAAEGAGVLRFPVTLSRPVDAALPVCGFTLGLSAVAFADFEPWAGCVTVPAGATSAVIEVTVRADARAERDERLSLVVAGLAAGVRLADPTATGTITDDD